MTGQYAVITGDLVDSSRFNNKERDLIFKRLKSVFKKFPSDTVASDFTVFSGDSFQGVLGEPEYALTYALRIRASLITLFEGKNDRLDARIAIGVGDVKYLKRSPGMGDGEAFRLSGPELAGLKKAGRNTLIKTPRADVNAELDTECALLDALMARWTREQAEAVYCQLLYSGRTSKELNNAITQKDISMQLKISQPAVHYRLRSAGYWAIEKFIERYQKTIISL